MAEQQNVTVLAWLKEHGHGDVGQMARDLGVDWREIEQRLQVLKAEGLVGQTTYRWDGSPVWHVQGA